MASPGEAIHSYFEKRLHPVLTGFRVFRRKPLRSGFGREDAIHLQNRCNIFSTTDPYFKGFSKFVSSPHALRLHNEMYELLTSPQSKITLGRKRHDIIAFPFKLHREINCV
jgi:hypothetical protein